MTQTTRIRRIRRTTRQVLRHGPKAKRTHKHLGGRTGSIRSKKLKIRKRQAGNR